MADAAARVEDGHAGAHPPAEDLLRRVEEPAQRIVEGVGEPPGADVSSHDGAMIPAAEAIAAAAGKCRDERPENA
jgi:hypothetical protein